MIAISVIIPTFNRLWSLKDTIGSCLDGKQAVEIIVVDDGSTDGTWEWLIRQDNIIALKQVNQGKCWAANTGFAVAKGKYIRFLDSDDLLPPGCNDEQFELAETGASDICVSGYKTIGIDGEIMREQKWVICDDFIAQQLGETDSSHYSAYLFRKEFIMDIPHRPDYAYRDDRLFVLEAALKDPVVSIHPGYGLYHRVHDNDRLQNRPRAEKMVQNYQHFHLYRHILGRLAAGGRLTSRRATAATGILWPLAQWMAIDNIQAAAAVLNYIYEIDPSFNLPRKGLKGWLFSSLGFKGTQQLLKIFRLFKYGIN